MRIPRQLLPLGFAALVLIALPRASAAAEPASIVAEFGNQTQQMLSNPKLSPAERRRRFRTLVDRSFDFPLIARFVLGRYWASTSEEERQEFTTVFEEFTVQAYAGRFSEYAGEHFQVTGERFESDRITTVSTVILHANGDSPTKLDWRVQASDGTFKITDVSISGVSMALSYREQFGAVIQRDDGHVATLIGELRQKIKERADARRQSGEGEAARNAKSTLLLALLPRRPMLGRY